MGRLRTSETGTFNVLAIDVSKLMNISMDIYFLSPDVLESERLVQSIDVNNQ
jgi:hypothetical protein